MNDSRSIRRFEDPHFPFVGHALRSRDSFFSDFFDKDPFDDPFFTRPFGSLFPSANDFFEPLHNRDPARLFDRHRQQEQESRGVVIEELPNDHENAVGAWPRSHSEPIVECPDDYVLPRTDRDGSSSFSQSFSFSSFSYGGPQGSYYKSSTERLAGADGLYEKVYEEKDSINGQETHQIIHGLGNKGHAVMRKKSRSGVEDYEETLHNLNEEEKAGFDESWKKQAMKYLPGHGRTNRSLWWNNHSDHEGNEEQVATSSSKPTKQLTWRWPWARKA